MAMPRKLKYLNTFLDGGSYLGVIESVTLPKLTRKLENYRGGGMSGSVEKVAVVKEVIEDWNEQRKEAAQRKAYDREKDMRYTDAAQNAVEAIENRGVVAANDDYEVEPIDTHTPSSWKELAEAYGMIH